MTKEDAKTRWCPMYRQTVSIDGMNREWADNRMDGGNPTCIGSACMAWRLDHERNKAIPNDSPAAHGFCGLAGKP